MGNAVSIIRVMKRGRKVSTLIISCKTLERELKAAMEQTGCGYEILWLEAGLHNVPRLLNERIQNLLDQCVDCDTVLLAMSFCGKAVEGLRTGNFRLIVPRCDDCISLLLGSVERRASFLGSYFLTEGWLKGERNIWREYQICLEKYGDRRGKRIFSAVLANYHQLTLIDTECYDRIAAEQQARKIAENLKLEYTCVPGTLDYLKALLMGDWDSKRFLQVMRNSTVTASDCILRL